MLLLQTHTVQEVLFPPDNDSGGVLLAVHIAANQVFGSIKIFVRGLHVVADLLLHLRVLLDLGLRVGLFLVPNAAYLLQHLRARFFKLTCEC